MGPRRFGTVAEVMVQRLKEFGKGNNVFHDLFDSVNNQRIEVKFSTVRAALPGIDRNNLLECILAELSADRDVPFAKWQDYKFVCNVQQVKPAEFETMYYGLFFDDCIKIFKIRPDQIDDKINYTDKQHKNSVGEGIFQVTHKNLQYHLDHFYEQTLDYAELLELLKHRPDAVITQPEVLVENV